MGSARATFRFHDATVLIVDENAGFMDLTAKILMGFGFKKFERLEKLAEADLSRTRFDPDLIVVDPFPDLEAGLRLIQEHRRREAGGALPAVVIVATGHTPRPLIELARRSGADYIVAKPFSASTLLNRILWAASATFANTASDDAEDRHDPKTYKVAIEGAAAAILQ